MNKIEQLNFKTIEAELYGYHDTKRELELMEEEILEGTVYQEVAVQTGTTADTTANKAVKLLSSKAILEVRRRIGAIDKAMDILRSQRTEVKPEKEYKDKLRLLEMKYFERKFTDKGIMAELNIEKTTFYNWKKEIVSLVSLYLGWKI